MVLKAYIDCIGIVLLSKFAVVFSIQILYELSKESATIHGLNYIASTRKIARLFWFLVVITGVN